MRMKVLNAILAIATLVSCGNTYNITGTSNVSMMDGQKLYLQVPNEDDWKNVDINEFYSFPIMRKISLWKDLKALWKLFRYFRRMKFDAVQ